ncbi:MAG: LamG-like jellyroll fold domain-containing protein [Chthoniobacteraceae bacterium]
MLSRFVLIALLFLSSLAMGQQNVTVVAVDPVDRLSGAAVLGEWVTDGNAEGWAGTNVTGLAALGGSLVGDDNSASADATVSRTAIAGGPDLDLGFNDYLQLRLKLPASYTGDVKFEYGTTTNTGFAATRQFVLPAASIIKDGAFHTYRLDMGLEVFWRDTLRDLRITPLLATTGHFEIDYVEVGDAAGTAPALNLDTNFLAGLNASNTTRMEGKHVCVWWDTASTTFTATHARRALRMCEESYQVYCKKLGHNEPFREFDSATTPLYKVNFITWYGGYWAGGYANRSHMNVDASGLADEGWGNPVPHEFGHVIQMAQPGRLAGGHWESHANYLRAQRNLHFYAAIPNAIPAIDNLTGNSNYRPDHNRHIYADQRYYLALDDYGTQFGLPVNYAATMWRDGARDKTLVEKLAAALPVGTSVKDVACECCKRWPMLDFVEKTRLRAQHWGTTANRAAHFWKQGAQLIPLQDKPGWWRVPLERAPDRWAYQMHDLTAAAGATITAEVRGLDLPGTGEDWRWCFAAISAGDAVRYSPVWAQGTQSFTLTASETHVFLIVTATPDSTTLDLDSLSNTKPVDKNADRLRYAYEVRFVNAAPAAHPYVVANPSGFHTHSNGGGVVGPSATVASTAYVGPNAKVLGSAKVLGTARIEDYAVVQGSAIVQGSAVVSGSALVEGTALVEGEARVRDRAWLISGAQVRGRALISGYCSIDTTTVQDDAIVRGCAAPFAGGTISGTAILDHDYSMGSSVSNGVHFSHVPWGDWWDAYYPQSQRKPRGLVASYRTEETSGEEWYDEFGALHALLRGAPARTADAALGSTVITFDGVDDYAALDRSLCDTSRFSFGCWVKPANAPGTVEPLLFLGSTATRAVKLVRNATGNAVFTISSGSTTGTLTSTSVLPANQWTHLAVTLSGTAGTLFVGGNQESTASIALTPLSALAANDGVAVQANYLGRDWAGALFKGSFDDVRFYNVTLTAAEVREESARRADLLGQFSPSAATDFNGTSATAESGVRNGRVRTLSAWVKPRTSDDVTNYEAIFDSDDERGSAHGGGLGLDAGKWVARLDGVGNWATNVTATLGKWQHVALAFNGTAATLFINGVPAATRSYTGPASDAAAAGKCYRIGFSQTTEDIATRQFFDGLILNARIHDRALTAAQIVLDSDGDGFNDSLEADFASDPLNPLSQPPQRTVSGKVTDTTGAALSGATVYFADSPNAAANATLTTTTDSSGNYSRIVTPGTWYVVAAGTGFNAGTERTVVVGSANVAGIDFSLAAYARVSGRITLRSNGSAAAGALVYFSRSSGAAALPAFTATADASGNYTQPLPDGPWYVAAGGASFYTSSDKTITLAGTDVGYIDFALNVRNIPRPADLLFSAMTENLPASGSTGNWSTVQPSGQALTMMGTPVVTTLNGVKWVSQLYADGDGFRQGTYSSSIAVNGATIVVAVMPKRNTTGTSWTSIVDLFYNRLVLGIRNSTGQIDVWRNGVFAGGSAANAIPDGQPTILSLVVQPTGPFKVFANGAQIMDITSTSTMTSLVPNVAGTFANALNVGRNNPDTWTTFNGNIGDVFVYKVALATAERQQIEADLMPRFVTTDLSIAASAGAGGSINPTGSVPVPPGGSQTFTFTPQADYVVSGVLVNGVTPPAASSYTFSNVTGNQTISATFGLSPSALWKQTQFGANASNPLIAGDLGDPDHDGIANLVERALGLNPNAASSTSLPTSSWTAIGPDNYLTLTVLKNSAASDLTYTVEVSSDLKTWNSGPIYTTVLDNTPTLLRVRDNTPRTNGTPRFIHLKVARP